MTTQVTTQELVARLHSIARRSDSKWLAELANAFAESMEVMEGQSRLISELQAEIRQLKDEREALKL